jgi:hypothetical protein
MVRVIEPVLASTRRMNPRRGANSYLAIVVPIAQRSFF